MRKRRRRTSHERWLVSYADFITLLFAFFVVMYSTARVDKQKVVQLSAAIQSAFQDLGAFPGVHSPEDLKVALSIPNQRQPSAPPGDADQAADLGNLQRELEKTLALEISRKEIALRNAPDGLVISLREIGFFDSGSANVKPNSQSAFGRIATLLLEHGYHIRIEGHTDNIPIHNGQFASNWELSTSRSTELVRLLITKYAFQPVRLAAAGYAEYHPIASNDSADGRAQNRRVDIVVLGKAVKVGAASQP
jgi:chemotaxis protein MotB